MILRILGVVLSFSLLLLGGCGGMLGKGTQEGTSYYQLHPISESSVAEGEFATAEEPIALAIGMDSFPEYLARLQIVTRTSDNKLQFAAFDHWAEPLSHNFTRVLVIGLGVHLSTDRIYVFPWRKNRPIDYELLVDVLRFDGEFGVDVVLDARWSLYDGSGKRELLTTAIKISEPVETKDYEAQVAAMSRAVGKLGREIAESIKNLPQGGSE
jgi:uncharacterized lipoprotein YmbA